MPWWPSCPMRSVYKVSIIPEAMGVTQQLPIDDRHTYKKDYLLATICAHGRQGR